MAVIVRLRTDGDGRRTPAPRAVSGRRRAAPLIETAHWGAYAWPEPYPDATAHAVLEATVGGPLRTMSWFVNWSADFPRAGAAARRTGHELLIAWLPVLDGPVPVPLSEIVAGRYDEHIARFLAACEAYGRPVTIRWAPEMNLGSHAWSAGQAGVRDHREFIDAWRHIHAIKRRVCPSRRVQLLWCISTSDGPGDQAELYWPGVDVVDKVGFDAYSGFTTRGWTEPADLIGPTYQRLQALTQGLRPIWCCEIGCRQTGTAEDRRQGRDKAQWLADLFDLTQFPNLTHVVFFHRDKEQDWRLDSSPAVLRAVRTGLARRLPKH